MGKIRHIMMGDEAQEAEQKKKAEARREAKKAKKTKDEEVVVDVPDAQPTEAKAEKTDKKKEHHDGEKKQKTHSKRYQDAVAKVDRNTLYPLTEAVALVKQTSTTKFEGTVEIHLNLNQAMFGGKNDFRGTVNLPHGTGKEVRVVIADDEVIKSLEAGKIDFDVLIAHPSMMPKLAKFARTLGPKGLMPNPKNGTVTDNPERRAQELAGGQVNFKTEPVAPIIHLPIGKVSFEDEKITENVKALAIAIGRNKITKATLTSTMGPGIKVDLASF